MSFVSLSYSEGRAFISHCVSTLEKDVIPTFSFIFLHCDKYRSDTNLKRNIFILFLDTDEFDLFKNK